MNYCQIVSAVNAKLSLQILCLAVGMIMSHHTVINNFLLFMTRKTRQQKT
jgi:hypothetical protein